MGHFDILLFQTPQDLFETALEAGTFWAKTDPFTAPVGPEGAWYDTVSANVMIWVLQMGESESDQMVSEKVKWA